MLHYALLCCDVLWCAVDCGHDYDCVCPLPGELPFYDNQEDVMSFKIQHRGDCGLNFVVSSLVYPLVYLSFFVSLSVLPAPFAALK